VQRRMKQCSKSLVTNILIQKTTKGGLDMYMCVGMGCPIVIYYRIE